jgi:hypothetical protein
LFRLGTVVRPDARNGEYDIDLVSLLPIAKESITRAESRRRVADVLHR